MKVKAVLPIDTSDLFPSLAFSPLLEAVLVQIISTRSTTPYNVLCLRLESREADWTVTRDLFSLAVGRARRLGRRGCGSTSKYLV